MEEKKEEAPVILLIENDENDVFIFRRALATAGYNAGVRVVGSATEARAYMENAAPYTDAAYYPRPSLIVSDYRLTGQTALEFVRWLRGSLEFADIPILVLSGAITAAQKEQLTELGARGFIGKTGDIGVLASALQPLLPPAIN